MTKIYLRRGTRAAWVAANPVVGSGEAGFETDTGIVRMGDGSSQFTNLPALNKLADLKDCVFTDLADGHVIAWDADTSKFINVVASGGHTQNTDTGTTGSTFHIDSDATGPKLKNNSGVLEVRNSGDTDYADLKVGNLTVAGTTTTVNSETMTVDDNVVVLNNNVTGTPSENAGIEIERGTSTNASMLWDESGDVWKCGLAGSEVEISLSTHNHDSDYADISHNHDSSYAAAAHTHDSAYLNKPASQEQGDVYYYNGSATAVEHHGNAGQVWMTGGHGANPSWGDIDGGSP